MFPPAGFLLSAAFVLGMALDSSGMFLPVLILIAGFVALILLITENIEAFVIGVLCLLLLVAGMARARFHDPTELSSQALVSETQFTGAIIDVPRHYPTASYTRVDLVEPERTRVVAHLPPYPNVVQGDVVRIQGTFSSHDVAGFERFSPKRDTAGVLDGNSVSVVSNRATRPQRWRATAADEIKTRLQERIPEPAGAFATGVILGDDGAMTESTRHAFRVGGLTHMTAVSGVHVGIIASVFLLLSRLGFISRWWMLGISVPAIWVFAYLVGMRPSVVRASLMLTLLIIAHFAGRPRDTLNAVGIAAALMLLIDPSFRNDVGFQLSVAATVGIALGILLLGQRSHWHLVWVVPISAQVATEPLILYHFGYYSLVSPLANVFATPFLAIAMAMSIITVAVSFPFPVLADIFAIGSWVPSMAVVIIADLAASFPGLSEDMQPLSLQAVWITYICLAGVVALLFLLLRDETARPEAEFSMLYRV
jgi:competence protein ComEC